MSKNELNKLLKEYNQNIEEKFQSLKLRDRVQGSTTNAEFFNSIKSESFKNIDQYSKTWFYPSIADSGIYTGNIFPKYNINDKTCESNLQEHFNLYLTNFKALKIKKQIYNTSCTYYDTHSNTYLDGCKPDCTFTVQSSPLSPYSVVSLVELTLNDFSNGKRGELLNFMIRVMAYSNIFFHYFNYLGISTIASIYVWRLN